MSGNSVLDEIYHGLKPSSGSAKDLKLEQLIRYMYESDKNLNMKTTTKNPFLMAIWHTLGQNYLLEEDMKESGKVVLGLELYLKEINVAENGENRKQFVQLFTNLIEKAQSALDKLVGKEGK